MLVIDGMAVLFIIRKATKNKITEQVRSVNEVETE